MNVNSGRTCPMYFEYKSVVVGWKALIIEQFNLVHATVPVKKSDKNGKAGVIGIQSFIPQRFEVAHCKKWVGGVFKSYKEPFCWLADAHTKKRKHAADPFWHVAFWVVLKCTASMSVLHSSELLTHLNA